MATVRVINRKFHAQKNIEGRVELPRSFVWSKIGTESGETLENIIRRKEIERRVCDGLFVWGVGNSMRSSLSELHRHNQNPSVVFSRMRSKPKSVDIKPSRLLLWLSYEDSLGNKYPLPMYSFVTSRGGSPGQSRLRSHYALLCMSGVEIDAGPVGQLDASTLVNVRSGRRVGYSQVTSAVARNDSAISKPMAYHVSFMATLAGPGQVRLVDYVDIAPSEVSKIAVHAEHGNTSAWKRAVLDVKQRLFELPSLHEIPGGFLPQGDMLETT